MNSYHGYSGYPPSEGQRHAGRPSPLRASIGGSSALSPRPAPRAAWGRRAAPSKKMLGSKCWVVIAENVRLLQRFHRNIGCIKFGSCAGSRSIATTGTLPRQHRISTVELEVRTEAFEAGVHTGHPRHQALCSFEGAETLRARLSYRRRPDSPAISPAALLGGGWQAAFR